MPACVDDLAQQSELVAKVAWGDEPPAVVGESIEALWRSQCRIDLALLLAVRSFECRAEHRGEGHASVVGWLQHHLHMKKSRAGRVARLCRFVSNHVEKAETSRFEDLARDLQAFADSLCPRDAEDRFDEQLAGRSFSKAGTIDGYGYLRGWMDPISYEIFAAEHDRLTDELFTQDWAFATEVLGRDPDENELAELTRTRPQRSHDALVEMARRSRTLAGGTVAAAAEVVLHTTQATYEEALRHKLADDPDGPDGPDEMTVPPGGFCETEAGTPVSPVAAVHLSLTGQVRRIVYGADDEIISWGRARRLFTPTQAAAIRAKYRRCTHPHGCDHTGRRLQIDHILEHQDGGPTNVSNGQPLEDTHNRWKTNQRGRPPAPGRRDDGQRRGPPSWC